jgi:hypothetical protein
MWTTVATSATSLTKHPPVESQFSLTHPINSVTTTSSKRCKEDIKPMGVVSEALFSLTPVTFQYKKEIDPAGISQFGLVAEDVEKVNPDLVVRDKEGQPQCPLRPGERHAA